MTHRARKNEKKENAIVYGVATDGFQYHFWLIDNQSTVGGFYALPRNVAARILIV